MLAPETVAFLEGGCSLVVGSVGADGAPHASRGWGATVLPTDPVEVRLLLDARDAVAHDYLAATGRIAVTGADVPTLSSIQFKGTVLTMEAGTDDDRARAERFCDAFFDDVARTDGTPRALMRQLAPRDFVACIVRVDELYDQTPGPDAGASIRDAVS